METLRVGKDGTEDDSFFPRGCGDTDPVKIAAYVEKVLPSRVWRHCLYLRDIGIGQISLRAVRSQPKKEETL